MSIYNNTIIEKIKNMNWGDTEKIIDNDNLINCIITKNVSYDTYIFRGKGSKNLLKYFISQSEEYKIIIQLLIEQKRCFMPLKNWELFWDNYDEPIINRHIFEVILSHKPCKPYLDIEWKKTKKDNIDEFIYNLCCHIKQIFKNNYFIELDNTDILISSSHSINKISFHIVINKIIDNKEVRYETNIKKQENSAWDLYNELIKLDTNYENKLDKSVYTTDREFRTIFSNKTDDFRPFIPYKSIIRRNSKMKLKTNECMKYLITHSLNESNYHIIKTPKYEEIKKNVVNDNHFISKKEIVINDEKIKTIIKLLQPIHKKVELTGKLNNGSLRFTYYDKSEPCYTGNYHNSNGFYVKEDTNNNLYMKCMSSKCKSIYYLKKNEI